MFQFPTNCNRVQDRIAYCLRYQEVMHERCIAGTITEEERSSAVDVMLPYLQVEELKAINFQYPQNEPGWAASKSDWNNGIINTPPGLDKANAYAHALRLGALFMDGSTYDRSLDPLYIQQAEKREAVLKDTKWDGDI